MSVSAVRTLARPGVGALVGSSLLGRMPLGMTLALLLLVRESTGSFGPAGVVVGAFGLATAAAAPLLGRLVDRAGQIRVLLPCAVLEAGILVGLVVAARADAPIAGMVLLGAAAGAVLPPISACLRALWPEIVTDPDERESAFALDATVQEVIWTTGPLVAGGIITIFSPSAAVLLMALVTLVGTAWFVSLPFSRRWVPTSTGSSGLLRVPAMRALLVTALLAGVAMGGLEVGLPGLAEELDTPAATGLLLGLGSFGSLVGGLTYGSRVWGSPVAVRYAVFLALAALFTAPLAVVPNLGLGLAVAFLSGLPWAPTLSCLYSLTSRMAPQGGITEAFTLSGAAIAAGGAGGVGLAGWLVDLGGSPAAFALAVVAAAGGSAVAVAGRSRY